MSVSAEAVTGARSTTRVFIVEDEALIAMELQDRLLALGYSISGTASRGEEALAGILAAKPDLVLMDVRLAGTLTGIDVAARLREEADVPVIFLSAYSDANLLRQAGTVEPFGYLVKPFEERELHASIQMALYRHRMEQALRESHAHLEERVSERTAELARSREDLAVTLNSIGDAVLATDARGRVTRMNPVAEQLTGWDQKAALGRPVSEVFRIINEYTREPVPVPVDRVLATGERQSLANHTALITRNGTELSIADSAAPIRDGSGAIVGVVLVFRDETEARERRKLVARQGAMLAALRGVQQEFINSPEASVPFDKALAVLLDATGSELGFVGEVQLGEQGRPLLTIHAAKGELWQELCEEVNAAEASRAKGRGTVVELVRGAIESGRPAFGREVALVGHAGRAQGPGRIDSFLGVPIRVAGSVVGLVGVAKRRGGYEEGVLAEIQPLLATYGSLIQGRRGALRRRAAEESLRELNADLEAEVERRTAERRKVEEALRIVSTELVVLEGAHFYGTLVERLATLLDVDIALVARLRAGEPPALETLAVFERAAVGPNFSFPLEGTGWAEIAIRQPLTIATDAQRRCASDAYVVKHAITALAAVPLMDRSGAPVGELVVMSGRPFENPARAEAILHLFAIAASAEIEQQRSNRRFHDLFEFSPDAIVMTDRNGLIRLVNRKAEAMFGHARAELDGQSIDVLMPGQATAWLQSLQGMLSGQTPGPVGLELSNLRAKRHDGVDFPIEISLGCVDTGEGVMIAAAIRDVTDRLNAERQANRARRMESIGTLAGGIAHDLNNTLTPILLALDALKQQYPGDSETLETVEASASHAAEMVRHLLAFARGTEGRRSSLQPRRLLEDVQKIIKGTFPKSIVVRLRAAKDLPTVMGDATQLHQVLLNLCVNARDAMPGGGVLTLEAEAVRAEEVPPDVLPAKDAGPARYVVLRVADTGTGIAPEVLERIFDPFFTTKGPESGTGLGLFTVAGIVKGHDGFIRLQSQPAAGSTFTVYLPAESHAREVMPARPASSAFHGDGETILYVDDEAAVRDVARTVLARLNFRPIVASDAMGGLIQSVEHRAELRAVITDLHMPQMDGVAFIGALRRVLPGVPVIVASGRLETPPEQELKRLGVQVILQKPFTEEMLRAALAEALVAPAETPALP
jgi:PAS domain S-box-containing protein